MGQRIRGRVGEEYEGYEDLEAAEHLEKSVDNN